MKLAFLLPRVTLILAGILLGLTARMVLGVPEPDQTLPREIKRELNEDMKEEDVLDLPIIKDEQEKVESGLVPPIQLPGQLPAKGTLRVAQVQSDFGHDPNAIFHAHGEEVCASGCAASRHPTRTLSEEDYLQLIEEYKIEPIDQTNNALEALLYYGPQTKEYIQNIGYGDLDSERATFLWEQLKCTSAKISLRVVDQNGVTRSWLDATTVPFDRRHVFDMKTSELQPLVTSGTVKRVGLNHAWVRL